MASFDKIDTRNAIIALVAQELKVDAATITDTATFESLGADSLDLVQIIMHLEERFGLEINDQDAERMTSLGEVVDYVHARRTQ